MALTPIDAAMSSAIQKSVNDSVSLRFGTVIAVNLAESTIEVELGDTPIKNVQVMNGANPGVGDVAWLLYQGSLLVCIGPGNVGGDNGGDNGGTVSSIPVGSVQAYAGVALPTGWLWCDGASHSTTTYRRLHTTIGFAYGGSGDQFKVPDLRDRSIVGVGSEIPFATTGGQVSINTVVAHSHGIAGTVTVAAADALAVSGSAVAETAGQNTGQNHGHYLNGDTLNHTHGVSASISGGSHGHSVSGIGSSGNTSTGGGANRLTSGSGAGISTTNSGSHSHSFSVTSAGASGYAGPSTHSNGAHWHAISGTTSAHGHTVSHNLSAASAGEVSTNVRNPYIGLNYLIKST